MLKYIGKRLLQLIPVLIGITFLSFAMMRLAGGDAVTYMYENAGSVVSQEVIDQTKKNTVWISLFWYSMADGLQEWSQAIWEPAMYPGRRYMILLWKSFRQPYFLQFLL